MSSSTVEAKARRIMMGDESLTVELDDGRSISVPLSWYPRLLHATAAERNNWRLLGNKEGIHWPDLDEDISVENLLLGKPSGESQISFSRWVEKRKDVESARMTSWRSGRINRD